MYTPFDRCILSWTSKSYELDCNREIPRSTKKTPHVFCNVGIFTISVLEKAQKKITWTSSSRQTSLQCEQLVARFTKWPIQWVLIGMQRKIIFARRAHIFLNAYKTSWTRAVRDSMCLSVCGLQALLSQKHLVLRYSTTGCVFLNLGYSMVDHHSSHFRTTFCSVRFNCHAQFAMS